MTGGVSAPRAMRLLTRLRLRRLLNLAQTTYSRRPGKGKSRVATSGKKRGRWIVTSLVAVSILITSGNIFRQSILNLHQALDVTAGKQAHSPRQDSTAASQPRIRLNAGPFSEALSQGLSMELSLLFVVATLMSLGTREMVQPDWDLEWLATLPIKPGTLLSSRIVERSVANPTGIMLLWPAGTLLAWFSDYRWSAPVLGALPVIPLLLLTALLRTLVDTGLRLSLPPSKLRNLQAAISIVALLLFYLVFSLGTRAPLEFLLDWARAFPPWAAYLPPGLVVQILNTGDPLRQAILALLLIAEVGVALWAGVRILEYQLRNGVVAASSRETARRPVQVQRGAAPREAAFGTPVQRREIRLLGRDRNFLVQTLVLPVIVVVSQLVINGRLADHSLHSVSDATVASIAFGIAAYTLMFSAFQILQSEGGGLWMLFTLPRSLESVLVEKARLWAVIALAYPVAVFAIGIYLTGRVDIELLGLAAVVLLGVPIYAGIAVSLGVFGCDPLAQETSAKLRPTYLYLYVLLASLYVYAIFASEWWQRLVLVVLSALLALALWQKARDEIPYLLDPAASPPARVSTSDGLIAAMMFFVFQGVAALIMMGRDHRLSVAQLITAYSIAGAATYGLMRLAYWRAKTEGVPSVWGEQVRQAVRWGAGAGVLAALIGLAYIFILQRLDLTPELAPLRKNGITETLWILLLVVVTAPLFEEFIFRGLIFRGLRRSWNAVPAIVASAALFAIVHPPTSMIPVFGLGICTGFAYNRTRILLAPMLAHALYNGIVVGYQLLQY